MFCFRAYHTTRRKILSFIYPKESEIYSETVVLGKPVTWEAAVLNGTIIKECISSVSLDYSVTKLRVWTGGQHYKKPTKDECESIIKQKAKTPWLWIGGPTFMEDMKDCSLALEPYLVSGNKITLELLYHIDSSVTAWQYIDPATFGHVQFPDEGITINAA
jgi:hypothetical protein